jgi:hypothetical protein
MFVLLRKIISALVFIIAIQSAFGQVATGIYPYGTFDNKGFDTINVGNLNVHFGIPILNKAGRGMNFRYNLFFDNSVWFPVTVNGTMIWQPSSTFGWGVDTNVATGFASYNTYIVTCVNPDTNQKKSRSCIQTTPIRTLSELHMLSMPQLTAVQIMTELLRTLSPNRQRMDLGTLCMRRGI